MHMRMQEKAAGAKETESGEAVRAGMRHRQLARWRRSMQEKACLLHSSAARTLTGGAFDAG